MGKTKAFVTGKTMEVLRKRGELPWKTEYYVSRSIELDGKKIPGFRKDLFGFCDVVSIKPWETGTNYYQVTTAANFAARMKKALSLIWTMNNGKEIEIVRALLLTKNRVFIVGWRKSNNRWRMREAEIVLENLEHTKLRLHGDIYALHERIGIDTLLGKRKDEKHERNTK